MNLDERAFKAAACRAWGRETAPAQLRARVERLLRATGPGPAALPAELGIRLIDRHDDCAGLQPYPGGRTTHALRHGAHPQLARLLGKDWELLGAAVCPVGAARAAHLLFARDAARVSVFSLSASVCPTFDECAYGEASINGHPVTAFVADDAMYCVVASAGAATPIDLSEVRQLRDRLRHNVLAGRVDPTLTTVS